MDVRPSNWRNDGRFKLSDSMDDRTKPELFPKLYNPGLDNPGLGNPELGNGLLILEINPDSRRSSSHSFLTLRVEKDRGRSSFEPPSFPVVRQYSDTWCKLRLYDTISDRELIMEVIRSLFLGGGSSEIVITGASRLRLVLFYCGSTIVMEGGSAPLPSGSALANGFFLVLVGLHDWCRRWSIQMNVGITTAAAAREMLRI